MEALNRLEQAGLVSKVEVIAHDALREIVHVWASIPSGPAGEQANERHEILTAAAEAVGLRDQYFGFEIHWSDDVSTHQFAML